MRRPIASGIWLAVAWMSVGCTRQTRPVPPPDFRTAIADTTLARAESLNAAAHATLEPGALHGVASAPVVGWTGPGGRPFEVTLRTPLPGSAQARRFGTITMQNSIRTRAPNVGQYPCTACHLGRATTMADARIADAHQNIKAEHPHQTGAACSTCHAPENVELLALKNGDRATLDHAYRVCAQCHFMQVTAWANGAHGKRLDGWEGRRVVMGCAECHDPHNPAVGSRIPYRAPRIERTRGQDK